LKWHILLEGVPEVEVVYRACKAIYAAEDLWVETGSDDIGIDLERGVVWFTGIDHTGIERRVVEEISSRYTSDDVRVVEGSPPPSAIGIRDAYDFFVGFSLLRLSKTMQSLLARTIEARREHALVLSSEGPVAAVLEGEKDRIVLPEIKACVFVHTHPYGSCTPSKSDLKASYTFFLNGGILEAIASPQCIWALWRGWLLGERDLEALIELERSLNEIHKSGVQSTKLTTVLSKSAFKTSFYKL